MVWKFRRISDENCSWSSFQTGYECSVYQRFFKFEAYKIAQQWPLQPKKIVNFKATKLKALHHKSVRVYVCGFCIRIFKIRLDFGNFKTVLTESYIDKKNFARLLEVLWTCFYLLYRVHPYWLLNLKNLRRPIKSEMNFQRYNSECQA